MSDVSTGSARPPLRPDSTSSAGFYWEGARAHRLLIQRCAACGLYVHYPRPVCRRCLGRELTPTEVSGRGEVYSHTVMEQAFHPHYADRVPYVVALLELEEQTGLRVLSNVVGCPVDDVHIGMAVAVDFEDISPELTLPVFRRREVA